MWLLCKAPTFEHCICAAKAGLSNVTIL
jgi:hypothetical protein